MSKIVDDLEAYFNKIDLPESIILSPYEQITDVKKFIGSHISMLRNNSGNKTFIPYYERLVKLKNKLK